MSAVLALLGEIAKWLFDKSRTLAGSAAIITAFSSIGVTLLAVRATALNMIAAYIPERGICALSASGMFGTMDIMFGAVGAGLAVRLTRIIAERTAKVLDK